MRIIVGLLTCIATGAAGCALESEDNVGHSDESTELAAATLIFAESFDSDPAGQPPAKSDWGKCSGNCTEVTSAQARRGSKALKTYLHRTDSDTSYRTEAIPRGPARSPDEHVEYWYGASIYVPQQRDDFASEIVMQWHHGEDRSGCHKGGGNPPMRLEIVGDEWRFRAQSGTPGKPINDCSKEHQHGQIKEFIPLQKGRWTDWVFHVVWSTGNDGLIEVWKDGQKVVNYRGPSDYANQGGSWLKLGLYKTVWRNAPNGKNYDETIKSRTYYHDEIRIARGPNGYALVNPAGGGTALVGEPSNEDAPLVDLASTATRSDTATVEDHFDIERAYDAVEEE